MRMNDGYASEYLSAHHTVYYTFESWKRVEGRFEKLLAQIFRYQNILTKLELTPGDFDNPTIYFLQVNFE